MKKQRWVLRVLLTGFTAFWALQAFAIAAITDCNNGMLKGSITTKNGYELQINARIDTFFPEALFEIKLGSGNETDDRMDRLLRQCFEVHPNLELITSTKGYTFTFLTRNGFGHYRSYLYPDYPLESRRDPESHPHFIQAYKQCEEFAERLGVQTIQGGYNAFYIDAHAYADMSERIAGESIFNIHISPVIEGLKLPPVAIGKSTAPAPRSTGGEDVYIDLPSLSFAFDSEGRLLSAQIAALNVLDKQTVSDRMISWEEALQRFSDIYEPISRTTAVSAEIPISTTVVLIEPSWLVSDSNVIRPGWHIVIDSCFEQPPILYTYHVGVDGVTGLCDM